MKKALEGLRIVETAEGIGVPYAGKLLADMGAEVIKVETPKVGDIQRRRAPFANRGLAIERSLTFQYANMGKKSVEIDLESEIGRIALYELMKVSDAWVRQGQPEIWADRGFGYDPFLSQVLPALNVVSVTPFGESGPCKNVSANPFVLAHMSGETALYPHGTGDEGRPPVILGGNFEEYDVGVIVAIGLLGSLLHTAASGAGQYLEIAEYEAHTMCVANELSTYPSFGTFVGREGSVQRAQSSLSYRTRDGWVNPFLAQTKEFVGMARVMGREEWIGEEWFMNARGRRENCEAISDAIQEWMLGYSTHEAVAILQENRVPMGPVASPRDVVDDEHLRVRGYFVEVESEAWGTFTCPGSPFVMEGTPLQCSAAPLLGSSNADVLGELLGFSDGDIQKITGIEREG